MDVQQHRLVEGDGVFQRAGEIFRLGDGDAFDTGGARPSGEIRVIGLFVVVLIEGGADLASVKGAALDVADRAPGKIVPHHPDGGNIVLHCRAQDMRHHGKATIAADRDTGAVRRGELGAENAAGSKAHAGKTPRVEHGLRLAGLPELHVPVMVNA